MQFLVSNAQNREHRSAHWLGITRRTSLNKIQKALIIISLVMSDLIMILISLHLAYIVRFQLSIPIFQLDVAPSFDYYRKVQLIFVPVLLIIFALRGLYIQNNLLGGTKEYADLFGGVSIGILFVITTGFIIPEFVLARGWLLSAWVLVFFFCTLGRFTLRRLVYWVRRKGLTLKPALIVGANDEGRLLAQQLSNNKASGFKIMGFIDELDQVNQDIGDGLRCLGRVENIEAIVDAYGIEEIILASNAISSKDNLLSIFKRFGVRNDLSLRFSTGLYEIITTGVTVNSYAYVPLVKINPVRLTGPDKVVKKFFDFILTIPGLILISPLLLLIAILIKIDSPGPILFRRRVLGVNGKEFDAYKFRTMFVNGDEILERYPELKAKLSEDHKIKNDPRITRIGKLLRKFSLDELPQLINVLKGDMSLVGPRMISPAEIKKFDQWDINLLTVRPGITGLWQVSGRSDISYDERVRLDMYYIRNWNIWIDVQILFQTIPAVLKCRGAY